MLQNNLRPGAVVIVKGLPARGLNGMQGTLLSYDKRTQRWEVQLTSKTVRFSLRAENLRLQRVSFDDSEEASTQKRVVVSGAAESAKKKRKKSVQEVNSLPCIVTFSAL
jgi:hypothetical protein